MNKLWLTFIDGKRKCPFQIARDRKQHLFDNKLGELLPDDPNGIYGEDFNFTCTLNRKHSFYEGKKCGIRLVYLTIGDQKFSPIKVLSHKEVLFSIRLNKTNSMCFVLCLIDKENMTGIIGSQYLLVGARPHPISLQSIQVKDWTKLQFTWNKLINDHYVTTIQSWWKLDTEEEFNLCNSHVESLTLENLKSCSIENLNELVNKSYHFSSIEIKINASNVVGTTEIISEKLQLIDIVKPSEILMINITEINSTKIGIIWEKNPNLSELMVYRIGYIDASLSHEYHEISTFQEAIIISNLIPNTNYIFNISSKFFCGGLWSNNHTFTYKPSTEEQNNEPQILPRNKVHPIIRAFKFVHKSGKTNEEILNSIRSAIFKIFRRLLSLV